MTGLLERIVPRRRRGVDGSGSATENGSLPDPGSPSSFVRRARIRRRANYLRRLRELELRDLGGFLVELNRFGLERPELVSQKLAQAARTDGELRALERALGSSDPVRELRQAGIGGMCKSCGTVYGSADRFCARCGATLAAHRR